MLRGRTKDQLGNLDDLDYEIVELINLINNVEGIETTNSCFGHNKGPVHIFCVADSIADLNKFIYKYFYCNNVWQFKIYITDVQIDNKDWDKVQFLIESDPSVIEILSPNIMVSELTERFKNKQFKEKLITEEEYYKEKLITEEEL